MKNFKYFILIAVFAIVVGVISVITFSSYGGNNCDQPPAGTCDCFCCNMFNTRGYEACARFGLIAGILAGGLAGYALLARRKKIKGD